MSKHTEPTFLFVPGLRDHVADHWQTLLADELPKAVTVPPLDDLVAGGWTPIPRRRLAFPGIVVASDNDPLARLDRVEGFARDWGSELVNAGAVGHLNPAAGFGHWPLAAELIRRF